MKINFTKKQYKDLIIMCGISNSVLGILGDTLPSTDYKEKSNKMTELEEYLLQYARNFECGEFADNYRGKVGFDDEAYEKHIMPIMEDYGDGELISLLSSKLAWRDFRKDHSEKEIEAMSEKNNGYFGVELFDYEKKYWDEFEKHGVTRLEIKSDK
jgi:hypothetical protein